MNKNGAKNGSGSGEDLKKTKSLKIDEEDARLRYFLQKAVKNEFAPERLRENIRRLIRQ